jgi:hypothetical protein
MKTQRQPEWDRIKAIALALKLPGVEETVSMRQPTLKAHGKLWVWWSPHEDTVVFKVPIEERELLIGAEPATFFVTPHYRGSDLILAHPELINPDWVRSNLLRVWRELAPKRVLRAFDAERNLTASNPPPKRKGQIASIQDYIARQAPADRAICELLAKEIDRSLPDAESKIWHAHPVWFLDGNPIVGFSKLKESILLLFWSGQSFDEHGLKPEGTFRAAEARFTDKRQIDPKVLRRWLEKSRAIQWDYRNIRRNRGLRPLKGLD